MSKIAGITVDGCRLERCRVLATLPSVECLTVPTTPVGDISASKLRASALNLEMSHPKSRDPVTVFPIEAKCRFKLSIL